jgi:hypothetical protein
MKFLPGELCQVTVKFFYIFILQPAQRRAAWRAPFTPGLWKKGDGRGDNQLWLRGEGIIFDQSKKSICNSNSMQICLPKVFPHLLLRE